ARRYQDPGEHLDGGGLSGPVGADVSHHLATVNREADVVDGRNRLILADKEIGERAPNALAPPEGTEFLGEVFHRNNGSHKAKMQSQRPMKRTRNCHSSAPTSWGSDWLPRRASNRTPTIVPWAFLKGNGRKENTLGLRPASAPRPLFTWV